jgi:DNA-binding NtrC family response regulator
LKAYPWPGNVREFRNVVERACILTQGELIDNLEILFPSAAIKQPQINQSGEFEMPAMPLSEAEKMVIKAAMKEAEGNKNKAAGILGLHRTTLYKKLEEYGIE